MNNHELEQLLKKAAPPRRSEEYWNTFPKRITARLAWKTNQTASDAVSPTSALSLGWSFALLALCLAGAFLAGFGKSGETKIAPAPQLAGVEKYFHEVEGLFPNQLQAIVFDERGAHLVLSDKQNVPTSTPILVKICEPKSCRSVVTFSGQQIQFNGATYEVLSDAGGRVFLAGDHDLLSPAQPSRTGANLLEARSLNTSL